MAKNTVVWKFPLNPPVSVHDPVTEVEMPLGAKVLTAQVQGNTPVLWAQVDPDAALGRRRFMILATGQEVAMSPSAQYIGTVTVNGNFMGPIVFHVFEVL